MFKFLLFTLLALASAVFAQSTCTPITITETYTSYITVPATEKTATLPVAPYPTSSAPWYPTGSGSAPAYPTATGTGYIPTPAPFTPNGASSMNGNVLIAAFAAIGAAAALL